MPAFNASMLYVLFFVAYLLVNLYLFMNLLLAVIFSNYKQHLQEEEQVIRKRQLDILMVVFERLASRNSTPRISYDTYTRLIRALIPDITENIIDAYWITLDITNKADGLGMKIEILIKNKIKN